MAGLPINIPIPAESTIISYDWTDLAEGTGNITFDGFACVSSTATTYHITRNVLGADSSKLYSKDTTETLAFNLGQFNEPKILQGTFTTTFTHASRAAGGSSGVSQVTIKIYHVRGATATEIGEAISPTISVGASSNSFASRCLSSALTKTHFAIGDILRVSAVVTASGTNDWHSTFHFDPLNRDAVITGGSSGYTTVAATNPTTFKISIPFKPEL